MYKIGCLNILLIYLLYINNLHPADGQHIGNLRRLRRSALEQSEDPDTVPPSTEAPSTEAPTTRPPATTRPPTTTRPPVTTRPPTTTRPTSPRPETPAPITSRPNTPSPGNNNNNNGGNNSNNSGDNNNSNISADNNSNKSSDSSTPKWVVPVAVIGGIIFVIVLIGIFIYMARSKNDDDEPAYAPGPNVQATMSSQNGYNPALQPSYQQNYPQQGQNNAFVALNGYHPIKNSNSAQYNNQAHHLSSYPSQQMNENSVRNQTPYTSRPVQAQPQQTPQRHPPSTLTGTSATQATTLAERIQNLKHRTQENEGDSNLTTSKPHHVDNQYLNPSTSGPPGSVEVEF